MVMNKTILVLGGGTGGIMTANSLSKKLRKQTQDDSVKILLFEKEEKNVFAPSLLWLMVGKREPEEIRRSSKKIVRQGIEVVIGEIEKIDPVNISVISKGREYKGDYMVVSLGTDYVTDHNLDKLGHNFFTLEGVSEFYTKLKKFTGGKIAILVTSLPFKCPASPYEATMLVDSFIRKKGLRDKTEIALFSPEPFPMPVAGKDLAYSVWMMLNKKGIKYFPQHQLTVATKKTLTFISTGGCNETDYDLLAYTPKHQCPAVITKSSLAGKSGWVEVDRNSMETTFPNVYAIGDNTIIPLEMGKPLPKAGVFAHYQAHTVAHNIAEKIRGGNKFKTFDGKGQCFIETGHGRAGYAGGNFYASPLPAVKMKSPSFIWHWAKVCFEKYWWYKYF